ncbi:glycosyltransferase family 4 protein [Bacillus sp. PAMC26568]|nr:glycosyltransferase family 4 protein [Bacillus sp. PAMC26568]
MQILIIVQDYPSQENKYAMNYVHTRNLEYLKEGFSMKVLSFNAKKSYSYEGIEVCTYTEFLTAYQGDEIDLIISHAPNLRSHIRFLLNKKLQFNKILFFIHGHEVMKKSKYYPEPYDYIKSSSIKKQMNNVYDSFKLAFLKRFMEKKFKAGKLKIIFVSKWMKDTFLENISIREKVLDENSYVISNSMNQVFIDRTYHQAASTKADFITVRPLDQSKYAVDLVVKLAEKHPDLSFHIYGKGSYFSHNKQPENIEVFQDFLKPDDLAELLNEYRCALMPTRLDAQGVMMCEIATYGMPIVTSDLPICKEMLGTFDNAFFMDNETSDFNLNQALLSINPDANKEVLKRKFSLENTIHQEMEVIKSLIKNHR